MSDEEDLTEGSGGVYKKLLRAGAPGGERPPPNAEVCVHYVGHLINGQKFDSSRDRDEPFKFKLGVGQVIEGWDIAVATMSPGEISLFTCRADYAYGWEGSPPKIPEDATLRFEVELISWEPPVRDIFDMTPAEKLVHGRTKREQGTALLKAGEHKEAAAEFGKAIEALGMLHGVMTSSTVPPEASRLTEVVDALRSSLLNHSQCCLKLELWGGAASSCSRVLTLEEAAPNVKALFRRGVAWTALERYEDAIADLKAACLLDTKSKELRDAYTKAKEALAAQKQAERQAFGGMFDQT